MFSRSFLSPSSAVTRRPSSASPRFDPRIFSPPSSLSRFRLSLSRPPPSGRCDGQFEALPTPAPHLPPPPPGSSFFRFLPPPPKSFMADTFTIACAARPCFLGFFYPPPTLFSPPPPPWPSLSRCLPPSLSRSLSRPRSFSLSPLRILIFFPFFACHLKLSCCLFLGEASNSSISREVAGPSMLSPLLGLLCPVSA